MNNIFETIATTDFAVFLLGLLGVSFYETLFELIKKCNPKVFSITFVILTYIVITLLKI